MSSGLVASAMSADCLAMALYLAALSVCPAEAVGSRRLTALEVSTTAASASPAAVAADAEGAKAGASACLLGLVAE